MSDRIGVFNRGRLEQVAAPAELYERPRTRFVAQFLGAANLFEGEAALQHAGRPAAMIRPERIRLGGAEGARGRGTVAALQYFGAFWRMAVTGAGTAELLVDLPLDAARPTPGDTVHLHWDDSAVHPLDVAE